MTIEFDLSKLCSQLKKRKVTGYVMSFDPTHKNDGDIGPCPEGGKTPEGEITSDEYIAKKSIAVEIKCIGCSLSPNFKVKVRKKI